MNRDVVVIGAGAAGVAAAVTAARCGARTLLVEATEQVGGMGAQGLHPSLCGLYRNDPARPFDPVNAGIAMEVVARLDAVNGGHPHRVGRLEVYAVRPGGFGRTLHEMVREQPGLHLALRTSLCAVERRAGAVQSIRLEGEQPGVFATGCVIDASGCGAALRLCGAAVEPDPGALPLAGYCFRVIGLHAGDGLAPVRVSHLARRAVERGEWPDELRHTGFTITGSGEGGVFKLNLKPDPSPDRVARATALGMRLLDRVRRELPEFRDAEIAEASPVVLERGGPVLRGEARLEERDVREGRSFDDACARGSWPVEWWDPQTGLSIAYLPPGQTYDIPEGCLRSAAVSGLYAAGRCISAAPRAQASVRVVGTCLATGEAAAKRAWPSRAT